MRVLKQESHDFEKEIQIYARTRSLTLVTNTREERDEWYDALTKAIDANALRRLTFNGVVTGRPVSAASSGSGGGGGGGLLNDSAEPALGDVAPLWIPDERVTMCHLCASEFTITYRRHHCRACGKIVCGPCSANKAPLKYNSFRADRVCNECYEKLKSQMEQLMEASGKGTRRKSTFYAQQDSQPDTLPSLTPSEVIAISDNGDNASGKLSLEGGEFSTIMSTDNGGGTVDDTETTNADVDYERLMGQFQRGYLGRISGRKKTVPRVLKEVAANDHGSSISGYLQLRKAKNHWKRQWFVIKEKVLYAYKASEDVAALSSTPLLGWETKTLDKPLDGVAPTNLLEIVHPGQPHMIFKIESVQLRDR